MKFSYWVSGTRNDDDEYYIYITNNVTHYGWCLYLHDDGGHTKILSPWRLNSTEDRLAKRDFVKKICRVRAQNLLSKYGYTPSIPKLLATYTKELNQ